MVLTKLQEYQKKWVSENREKVRLTRKKYRWKHRKEFRKKEKIRVRLKNKKLLFDFKKDKCCFKCRWKKHPQILQFHHRDPTKKFRNVGLLAAQQGTTTQIKAEIEKCVLLCPNCHFLFHYENGVVGFPEI